MSHPKYLQPAPSLFADISLYRCIRSPADYTVLQSNITAITVWIGCDRHLKLHADNCCCMFISRKWTHSISPLHCIYNSNKKYLGVILISDLAWSEHITRICTKARELTGLLYRRFHHCNPELMLRLYKAFIRPHFEYAPQVWDPHLEKDIQVLENLRNLPCKFVHGIGLLPIQNC